jgi:hypothetical protein
MLALGATQNKQELFLSISSALSPPNSNLREKMNWTSMTRKPWLSYLQSTKAFPKYWLKKRPHFNQSKKNTDSISPQKKKEKAI